MTHFLRLFSVSGAVLALLTMTSCTKPTKEQVVKALQENPSLLADLIKKDPNAFKDALQTAQEQLRKSQMQEQHEQMQKEMEKAFKEPLQPKLGAAQVYKGAGNAKVVIVEYTDFECPYCSRGAEVTKELLKKYDGKVKVTVKHLPLPFHQQAMPAAKYFEAIRMQNPKAAIEFHDTVFSNQNLLRQDGEKYLDGLAKKLGVNAAKLKADLKSDAVSKKIEEDMEEAKTFGFRGTPSFLVGGVPVRGALPTEEFAKIVDRLLQK